MKRISIVVIVLTVAALGLLALKPSKVTETPVFPTPIAQSEATDLTASFAIFTNGTSRIFTSSRYHNLSTDVYIESSNPNRVHVKKSGVTWKDFFATLPMKLSQDCLTTGTGQTFCTQGLNTLKFYINGQFDAGALDRVINPGDRLLVSYGDESESEIEKQIDK